MSSAHPWTGAEVRRAVALRQREGLTLAAIGERLGRSAKAVGAQLHKLGHAPPWREPVPAMPVEQARAAAMVAAEIAAARREAPALAAERRLYRGGWP